MNIFFNAFFRTLGFFFAILLFFLIIIGISAYTNSQGKVGFNLIKGNEKSNNAIFILEINGPIIESGSSFNDLVGFNFISPIRIKKQLEEILIINPKILIVSINSPGGTVSASNELYNSFLDFKKKTNASIIFHTSEILASGGYWSSLAGEKIYASYGSIIGSIGVKGPDWFYFNKPKLISSGFLGQTIEVENEIEVYSTNAGKSKDLFNLFRKPTNEELNHLNKMVEKINTDFINLVSKHRKLEKKIIKDEIGGLIFNSFQAKNNFLIDDEISLDELLNLIIKENKFKDFKVYTSHKQKGLLLDKLISINFMKKKEIETNYINICNRIKMNIVSILSYSSVGC
ncbi:S49 family peptidase [Pelagibacteraceae bacterium]|nr:S49 family peptidase [Pelagibacteraceae bacterium]